MSQKNDSLTLTRVEDLTLGVAAFVPDVPALNRLVACVGSAGGKDKFLALVQYTLKLVAQFLAWRAQVQHRAGRRLAPTSDAAPALTKFAGIISDARMVHNITSMFGMWRWLKAIESQPYKTRRLRTIERLQGWSILLYFPLEHICYLIGHGVLPAQWSIGRPAASQLTNEKIQSGTVKVDVGKLTRISMGLWGLYTVLQLLHYREDLKELVETGVSLSKTKADATKQKLSELKRKRTLIMGETIAQLCNLPLAIHWGTGSTLIKSELVVNLLNLTANLASFRSLWITNGPPPDTEDAVTDPDILAPVGLDAGLDEI
ncbi:uncharacterized protein PHACADRAFT_252937 [Phanerochaete carnosa HHB-10118-sp]|uniref:Uncharacterized protein n=1 Tax=Phanerochaete carnosa (strain HHB-10118-sp) TaxID=650164 RepID=K5V710_PHACS|nr:uncharacterized protein PHACADRAFT_252937 [Phanerochaete carnosa HHB-10118-sp]EKM58526.1 hypothetical protein PHACADRAFT_252937 [Phanerochaete carnosa HHB-10118-sp]